VGDRSRGRYTTTLSLHTTVPRFRRLHVRRWGLGCVNRSRAIFCRAVPNRFATCSSLSAALSHTHALSRHLSHQELHTHLEDLLGAYPVDVRLGNFTVEIKPKGITKAAAVQAALKHMEVRESRLPGRIAMCKMRIARLGFGTGRQNMVLEGGTTRPLFRVVRVALGTGYTRVRGIARAWGNGGVSSCPPQIRIRSIRNFHVAVWLPCRDQCCLSLLLTRRVVLKCFLFDRRRGGRRT
jgi:hypothetical protein